MAKGNSGRIVIEVEIELKNRLYSMLSGQGMTLKDWFIKSAEMYMADNGEPRITPICFDSRKEKSKA